MKREIYYSIFDANSSLLDNVEITGFSSTKEALLSYLKNSVKVRRVNGNKATYCVTPFFYENGNRYKYGKRVWYQNIG